MGKASNAVPKIPEVFKGTSLCQKYEREPPASIKQPPPRQCERSDQGNNLQQLLEDFEDECVECCSTNTTSQRSSASTSTREPADGEDQKQAFEAMFAGPSMGTQVAKRKKVCSKWRVSRVKRLSREEKLIASGGDTHDTCLQRAGSPPGSREDTESIGASGGAQQNHG